MKVRELTAHKSPNASCFAGMGVLGWKQGTLSIRKQPGTVTHQSPSTTLENVYGGEPQALLD